MKHLTYASIAVLVLAGPAMPAGATEMTGKQVFDHYCSYCHGAADGPGTMQLRRTRGKNQALLAERTNLAPDYIEYVVRHGLRSMPAFVPSDLTEARLKALAAFLTEPLPKRSASR
jgi:mono/diheme cytochrome c family protein